jgi:hypothetical protein
LVIRADAEQVGIDDGQVLLHVDATGLVSVT